MSPTTTELLDLKELERRFSAAARATAGGEPAVRFGPPRRLEFGDFATNVAFELAKIAKQPPQALSQAILDRALADPGVRTTVASADATGGFINVRLAAAFWQRALAGMLTLGADYGRGAKRAERISLEFGSANPTGPLVVVQGRTLSIGDTLARTMRFAGYDVLTEWIINDAGSQMDTLGRSLYARYMALWNPTFPFPENGYPGSYLLPLAEHLRRRDGDRWRTAPEEQWLPALALFARDAIVAEQQQVAEAFRARNDHWQSEAELHANGAIAAGLDRLRDLGATYEKDGAVFVPTSKLGDEQDRVAVRSDGRPAYFANDVAYHYDKLNRAERVIDILGPDHHGYIARLKALAEFYGRAGAIEVLIAQQITLKRGDEIVSMSKRAGEVVTLADVIDEVGVDAARFYFVNLSIEQPLTFDLALAKAQSNDNPVYYVQYGHARIASVLRRAEARMPDVLASARRGEHLERLTEPAELALVRRLWEFPATVEGVARSLAPHRLTKFAREVAADFHHFYDTCRPIVGEDGTLSSARLSLSIATLTVLAQTLGLCGVTAPEAMEREREVPPAEA